MNTKFESLRPDYRIISGWINQYSSVLDLGCGAGDLLYLLIKQKDARGQGIEIDEEAIYKCVEKGLNVFHGDIDSGLADYHDKSFDYVVLNQSLQQTIKPAVVLSEALRVGERVIAGFPNFSHYRARWQMAFRGIAPVTPALPYRWFETPNLHFLSIFDFQVFCREKNIRIEKVGFAAGEKAVRFFPNLFAETGLFLISDSKPPKREYGKIKRKRNGL